MQCVSRQDKEEPSTINVKVVAVGEWKSGKTHLLLTLTEQTPVDKCIDLIYSFRKITIENVEGKELDIAFFNTDCREDFDRLRPILYPKTDLVLACYSIVNPDTLRSIPERWIPEVRHHLPKVPIILVGCWKELRKDQKTLQKLQEKFQEPVPYAEGRELADEIGAVAYLECSPKTADGVPVLLQTIAKEFVKDMEERKKKNRKNICILL